MCTQPIWCFKACTEVCTHAAVCDAPVARVARDVTRPPLYKAHRNGSSCETSMPSPVL